MQILNRELTADLLAARGAIVKNADASLGPLPGPLAGSPEDGLYKMGFHFQRYVTAGGMVEYLPSMHGSGDNELILFPNRVIFGEVRGGEAADLLEVLNTGHPGSFTTIHANSAMLALSRLTTLALRGDAASGSGG